MNTPSTEVVRPECTTVLVMPQADESLHSRRHAIYFRSQYLRFEVSSVGNETVGVVCDVTMERALAVKRSNC